MRSIRPVIWSWQQLRTIIEADPLKTTREFAKQLTVNHSTVIQHLKQTGKMKRLDKWVPHELTEKKIVILKCHLLLFYTTTMNHFSIRLWHVTKSKLYITTNQFNDWTKKKLQSTSQSQTCTEKGHGHCLVFCCNLIHHNFLNPGENITSEKYAQ